MENDALKNAVIEYFNKNGWASTEPDKWQYTKQVQTGNVVINGVNNPQVANITITAEYIGNGTMYNEDDAETPICGIRVYIGPNYTDIWIEKNEDIGFWLDDIMK